LGGLLSGVATLFYSPDELFHIKPSVVVVCLTLFASGFFQGMVLIPAIPETIL